MTDISNTWKDRSKTGSSHPEVGFHHGLALALAASTTTAEAMPLVVKAAMQLSGADCGGAYLLNRSSEQFELICYVGVPPADELRLQVVPVSDPRASLLFAGKPRFGTWSEVLPWAPEVPGWVRCLAVLPIKCREDVIGCINIGFFTEHFFTPSVREELEALVTQLGSSIARIRVTGELREAEERYRTIVETCSDAVFIASAEGEINFCNHRMATMCGFKSAWAVPGKSIVALAAPSSRETVAGTLEQVVCDKCPHQVMATFVREAGAVTPVELDLAPLLNSDGEVVGFVGFARDTTKRRAAELRKRVTAEFCARLSPASTYEEIADAMSWATLQLWNWDASFFSVRRSGRNWFTAIRLTDTVDGEKAECVTSGEAVDYSDLPDVLDGRILLINRTEPMEVPVLATFGSTRKSQSLIFAPLKAGTTVAGILSIQSYTPGYFSRRDFELLSMLGDIAGPALQRCRAERLVKAFCSMGAMLSSATTARDAAFPVMEVAWDLLGWRAAFLDFYMPRTGKLVPLVRIDRTNGTTVETANDLPSPYIPSPILKKTLESGPQLVTRDDVHQEDLGLPMFGSQLRAASMMFVPVRSKENTVGVLSIQHTAKQAYTAEDLELLQSLADHCAGALDRTRVEFDRNRLALAVESAAESIVIAGKDWRIRYVNPAFEQVSGYSREEAVGKHPRDLLDGGAHSDEFYDEMAAVLSSGARWKGRFTNRTRDGREFIEDATISPMRGQDGELLGYVGVKRDVTHEISMESELARSQKMNALGELAGHVAHDFNNLLQVITGYTQNSLLLLPPDSDARPTFEHVMTAARKGATLTRQLMAFGRRQSLQPKSVKANTVISELESILQTATGRSIETTYALTDEDTSVFVDRTQLEMCLVNLVINARDAMPDGGTITIATRRVGASDANGKAGVEIIVSDTGTGIPPEIQPRIFEPFFTTKREGEGTGLGLSGAYGFVTQSGGRISFSTTPDEGTSFRVWLPAHGRSDATRVSPERPNGHITVLLVDNDDQFRGSMAESLRAFGYEVMEAANAASAITLSDNFSHPIALLATALEMPEIDGRELSLHIIRTRHETRILYLSKDGTVEDLQTLCLELNADYLLKPVTPHALAEKVGYILAQRAAAQ